MAMQSVIELPRFTVQAERLFSPREREEVIDLLASDPEAGDVVPGTGGVRKLRVAASGRGKSGGARVIYYYLDEDTPVFAIAVYAKNEADDLSPEGKRQATLLVQSIKAARRRAP